MTAATPPLPAPPVLASRWVALRLGLVGLWLATAVAGFAVYERPATLQDLYAAVATGEVDRVWLAGGLPPGAEGYASQQVHWRDGRVPRVTRLVVVSTRVEAPLDPEGELTSDDVGRELVRLDVGLQVTRADPPPGPSASVVPSRGGRPPRSWP